MREGAEQVISETRILLSDTEGRRIAAEAREREKTERLAQEQLELQRLQAQFAETAEKLRVVQLKNASVVTLAAIRAQCRPSR